MRTITRNKLLMLSIFGIVSMTFLCHAATSTYVNIPDATLRKAINKALGASRAAAGSINPCKAGEYSITESPKRRCGH